MPGKSFLVLTEKGLALLAAVQSGLVQKEETDRFDSFWDLFEQKRQEQMLNQEGNAATPNGGENRPKDRRPILSAISSFLHHPTSKRNP